MSKKNLPWITTITSPSFFLNDVDLALKKEGGLNRGQSPSNNRPSASYVL